VRDPYVRRTASTPEIVRASLLRYQRGVVLQTRRWVTTLPSCCLRSRPGLVATSRLDGAGDAHGVGDGRPPPRAPCRVVPRRDRRGRRRSAYGRSCGRGSAGRERSGGPSCPPPHTPNQGSNDSNQQMIDHEPPRTARTKLLLALPPLFTIPVSNSTTQAKSGPVAKVVDDQ